MKFATPLTALRSLLAGSALAFALLLGGRPEPAVAMGELRTCTNAAWADYNSCLMESDGWFHRKGCDLYFQAEYALCWSRWGQAVRG